MSRFTLSLDSTEAVLAVGGGKGANLSILARSGFQVPPGFLINTAAYRAFVEANSLENAIRELTRSAREDPGALATALAAVNDLFSQASIPNEVAEEIAACYVQLANRVGTPGARECTLPLTAIRSSATVEDSADASFAGQFDTYLNLHGQEAVLHGVKRCWQSLWTLSANAYCARRGIPQEGVGLAVVVQQMVPAESAGILHTINPLDGNVSEMVINAAWGLGNAVVSGRVSPDTVVADKATGREKRCEIGDKAVMTALTGGGTTEVAVDPSRRRQAVLAPAQVAELVRVGRAIEALFGSPQDIEWATAGPRVYILQSRPVTGVPLPVPLMPNRPAVSGNDQWPAVGERPCQSFDLWTQANLGEVWPHPVSPLLWSGVPEIISRGVRYIFRALHAKCVEESQWAKRYYGRIYYNEGALVHVFTNELGLPGSFVDIALGSRLSAAAPRGEKFRPARFLRRLPFFLRTANRQQATGRDLEALFEQIDRWANDLLTQDLEHWTDQKLWTESGIWRERLQSAINLQFEITGISLTTFSILQYLLDRWLGRKDLARDLLTGLSGVYAAEMQPALSQMCAMLHDLGLAATVIDKDPVAALRELQGTPAAQPVMEALEAFLQRHGHRCLNEGEWLYPRWAESPEQVVELLGRYLLAKDPIIASQVDARQRQSREAATAWVKSHLNPIRWSVFRHVLGKAQHAARLRENGKHYYVKTFFPLRKISMLLGNRWTGRGWLRDGEDIFFLTIPDIERLIASADASTAASAVAALVEARRKAFRYWSTVEPPEIIGSDGTPVQVQPAGELFGASIQGVPASRGLHRGPARIIRDPSETNRLQPGEILVARAADPGWIPILPHVGALVLEVGGQLSHVSIIAREYGVPTVVNVRDAMRRIQDGQTITVDGTAGQIYLGS